MIKLSVIVPAYNAERTIEACLRSIRGSTYPDYELIVIDDHSVDNTAAIARKYADIVVKPPAHGLYAAIQYGSTVATGEIIVNIDSDVLIKPNSLKIVHDFFLIAPEVAAITGLLSKEHPNKNFFSQYKNLYMHYTFKKLPREVSFLYGSIFAVRRDHMQMARYKTELTVDTALGQELSEAGKKIIFLSDLEVVHLKKYGLLSFIKNDYVVPFWWANIFMSYAGWRQIGKVDTGYAHSPKEQLLSVMLAPAILSLTIINLACFHALTSLILLMTAIWIALNLKFLGFLTSERGVVFGIMSTFVTFIDNIVMAAGIAGGLASYAINHNERPSKR